MLSLAEILRSTRGAWDLFLGRRLDLGDYDISVSGFWRSFQVILLIAPLYVIVTQSEYVLVTGGGSPDAVAVSFSDFLFAGYLSLAIDWFLFPLALMPFAGVLGIGRHFVPFVIVRNWTQLLTVLIATPFFAAHLFGLISEGFLVLALLVATIVFLRYRFIVTRASLECSFAFAAALVTLEFVLSMVIAEATTRLALG